ncbi:multifunctional CCA tRNA nucleotidyl transferase/2'3'-cyclic phosphodiesterase/2'nucleotidase/phosphatase [Neisseriaceae bacterium PsAf]|nr:multifunctional CCA tRNA nucleotidyl transferase/2'3'-cyclic phosphodiesterase/2'nucleotidase/phosphatase [Neisseriaceae bacterium PsAf]
MKIYLVGGAVRDYLLGTNSEDKDWVVVGSTVEEMVALGFKPVGKSFPVFIHPDSKEEYALARTEKKVAQGYHGFTFHTGPSVSLNEDLLRRDLTINAMAMDGNGNIIDPYHGREDLKNKILRHVSPAFSEDPLRVLRLARFVARFGFEVDPETRRLVELMVVSGELNSLTKERVWQEFSKGLSEKYPYAMLLFLFETGVMQSVFPELYLAFDENKDAIKKILESDDLINLDLSQRLASMVIFFESEKQVRDFLTSLRVPKKIFNYVITFYRIFKLYKEVSKFDAETILSLFEVGDAFRQLERFESMLCLLKRIENCLDIESDLFEYDLNRIFQEIQALDIEKFIIGKAESDIQQIIRDERLKAIQALL